MSSPSSRCYVYSPKMRDFLMGDIPIYHCKALCMNNPIVIFHKGSLSILDFDGYWLIFLAEKPIIYASEIYQPHQLWQTTLSMLRTYLPGTFPIKETFVWEITVYIDSPSDGGKKTVDFRCAATSTPDHWSGTSYKEREIHAMPVYDNDILEKLRMFVNRK